MQICKLKIGTPVGTGVTVTGLRRDGAYSHVTLSTGRTVRLHKFAHSADLFLGHMPGRSLMRSEPPNILHVAASSRVWRGEYPRNANKGDIWLARSTFGDRTMAELDGRRRAAVE